MSICFLMHSIDIHKCTCTVLEVPISVYVLHYNSSRQLYIASYHIAYITLIHTLLGAEEALGAEIKRCCANGCAVCCGIATVIILLLVPPLLPFNFYSIIITTTTTTSKTTTTYITPCSSGIPCGPASTMQQINQSPG